MPNKGQRHTPETLQKIRNSLKGRSAWNINKSWGDLERRKIGIGKRGIFKWIKDKKLENVARRDYATAQICEEQMLFKPAIILYAGVIEALLRHKISKGKSQDFSKLIQDALQHNLIRQEQANYMHTIRDIRNYVHIHKEISTDLEIINEGIAKLCRQLCDSVIKTLKNR